MSEIPMSSNLVGILDQSSGVVSRVPVVCRALFGGCPFHRFLCQRCEDWILDGLASGERGFNGDPLKYCNPRKFRLDRKQGKGLGPSHFSFQRCTDNLTRLLSTFAASNLT